MWGWLAQVHGGGRGGACGGGRSDTSSGRILEVSGSLRTWDRIWESPVELWPDELQDWLVWMWSRWVPSGASILKNSVE